jgi:hypothetical protein
MGVLFNLEWLMRGWVLAIIVANKLKIGAELGVYNGGNCFFLLDNCPDLVMHGVDIFELQPGHPDYGNKQRYDFTRIYPGFLERAKKYGDRFIIHKGWTHEVVEEFEDHSLDFVFIDADHRYEPCRKDILLWKPKVRPGGFLMGHDIHEVGVLRAVKECCPNFEATNDYLCWVEKQ